MLDRQAPDIQVIADRDDDINDEAAVYTNRQAEHAEHVGDLVHAVAEGAGLPEPAHLRSFLQHRAKRVEDAEGHRDSEHVVVGEVELDEVRRDHLPHRVRVHDAGEDDERDQVVLQDVRLQPEVCYDEDPGEEERNETHERIAAAVAARASRLDHVARRLDRVEHQNHRALVP